jgi:hypothetical protein
MIAGTRLKAWLADREAQHDSHQRASQAACRLKALPALSRLREQLDMPGGHSAQGALALARAFIGTKGALDDLLQMLIANGREDPYFRPPVKLVRAEVHSALVLVDHPNLTLSLAVMDADAIAAKRAGRTGGASLVFSGRQSLFHFLKGGGATLSFWEAPKIEPGFTGAASGQCRFVESRTIREGDTLEIDGRSRTFIVDTAAHDLVYLQATTGLEKAPLTVEYDAGKRRFLGASSNDEASSRIQLMLSLLRTMDRVDAVPLFEELLASEHFYARWQTMREFLALDAEAALPHLRSMAVADPHPEVRQAAESILARFFPENPAVEEEALCPA